MTAAMLYDVAAAVIVETLSCVWLEAAMFGCAAITYLAVSGGMLAKKPLKGGRTTPFRSLSAKHSTAKTATYPRSEAAAVRITASERKISSNISAKNSAAKTASCPRSEAAAARITSNEPKMLSSPDSAKMYASVANNIRERGNAKDLQGAVTEFERLPLVPNRMGEELLNSIVQACMSCGDCNMVKHHLLKGQSCGARLTHANTRTLIKALLAANQNNFAEMLLKHASSFSLQASQACFHEVLHAHALVGDCKAAWCVIADMRNAGFMPNQVSCSILLKLVSSQSQAADLSKIIEMLDNMDASADDVLVCSITEACLRVGRLDLLSHMTFHWGNSGHSPTLTAPIYGAMIKAFGQAGYVERIWALWDEMQLKGVEPTEISLGCMVEALVANTEADAAWRLVREIWQDVNRRHLVNTVTYSTLLKGVADKPEQVEAMYQEMRERQIQCNTITYNTILNHLAQCRATHRVPQLLEDMKNSTPPVEPDIVTYSTLIKCFCASGNLNRALGLLTEMRADGKFVPDEMMYNTLLDGCAKEQRLSDALRLVQEMKNDHVRPSNYTLSMLVKLMGRCKKLSKAFDVVDSLTEEFGFRPNIQVYTCLIQACFINRQPAKALSLLDRILEDGLRPDAKTYVSLVRGHLQMGLVDAAVELVRRSYRGDFPVGVDSQCLEEVVAKLGKGSAAAAGLRKDVEDMRQHQRGKGHSAAPLHWSSSKTKTSERSSKNIGKQDSRSFGGAMSQVQHKAVTSETVSSTRAGAPWRQAPLKAVAAY